MRCLELCQLIRLLVTIKLRGQGEMLVHIPAPKFWQKLVVVQVLP